MTKNDSFTKKSYEWLENICNTRLYEIYSRNIVDAYLRMQQELKIIKQQGSAPLFRIAYDIIDKTNIKRDEYFLGGYSASSIVLYLLNISDMDPLTAKPRLYSFFCFGINGEIRFSIDLFLATKAYRKVSEYIKMYSCELKLEYKYYDDAKLRAISINTSRNNDYKLEIGFNPISKRTLCNNVFKGEIFDLIKPATFEEKVKCYGLNLNKKYTWDKSAKQLYLSGKMSFNKLTAYREDVFEFLLKHHVDIENAFEISQYVGKGLVQIKGWEPKMVDVMKKAKIPSWYLDSISKLIFLPSRAHAMSLISFMEK